MDRIQEFIEAWSSKEVLLGSCAAKQSHMCEICAKPVYSFETPLSKLEYSMSSICQSLSGLLIF